MLKLLYYTCFLILFTVPSVICEEDEPVRMKIQVDVANVREKPDEKGTIINRLPIETTVFGNFIDSNWFRIDTIRYHSQTQIPLSGYLHRSTLTGEFSTNYTDPNDIENLIKEGKLNKTDALVMLERAYAHRPGDTTVQKKLIKFYLDNADTVKAMKIDSAAKGLDGVLIAVPLTRGRTVVIGQLFQDGKFTDLTYSTGEYIKKKRPEGLRRQLAGLRWWPVHYESFSGIEGAMIFPKLDFGTFGPQMSESQIEWIELTPQTVENMDTKSPHLRTDMVLTTVPTNKVPITSALISSKALNNKAFIDSLYKLQTCANIESFTPALRLIDIIKIPNTSYYDIGFLFDDNYSNKYGVQRVITDDKFNIKFSALGSPGLWFTPVSWNKNILISISSYTSDGRGCEYQSLDEGIIVIMIMPDKSIRTYKIVLGAYG